MKHGILIKPFVGECFAVKVRFRTLGKRSSSRPPTSRSKAASSSNVAPAALNILRFRSILAVER